MALFVVPSMMTSSTPRLTAQLIPVQNLTNPDRISPSRQQEVLCIKAVLDLIHTRLYVEFILAATRRTRRIYRVAIPALSIVTWPDIRIHYADRNQNPLHFPGQKQLSK